MSEFGLQAGSGLAGLLWALQPRIEEPAPPPPPPDLDAIHAAGWSAGFVAGEAAATAALIPLRDNLAAAAAALETACRIDVDGLRPLFATLVRDITATVLLAEAATNDTLLLPLVAAALTMVRTDEVATLRAHPDTLAALQPHLPIVAVAPDADLARDAFSVSGPSFLIETALSARLAAIVAGLA